MSRLLKIILYTLSVVTTVCGIVLFSSGASDFFKITFGTTVDINTNDTSQYTKDTMACGTVYYTIDTIANANDTIYYLVPTKSEKYLIVATSNQTQIDTLNTIASQTYEYLKGDLQDTTTNLEVLFVTKEPLKKFFSTCDFLATKCVSIMKGVKNHGQHTL